MHKKRTHTTPNGHQVSKLHTATIHSDAMPVHPAGNVKPTVTEDDIRILAHAKWEAAGCPPGDGFDFWLAAELEVACNDSVSVPT
jgi:hypothetical protein